MTLSLSFGLIAVLIAIDQLTKYWVLTTLKPISTMMVIEGLLSWTYVENRGAAFGIFNGQRGLLLLLAVAVIGGLSYVLVSKKVTTKVEQICLCMIIAGGTGNFIDRIAYGFVVDFIDINQLFTYPMFNFADCCVVVGAIVMVCAVFIDEHQASKAKKGGLITNETDNSDSDQ